MHERFQFRLKIYSGSVELRPPDTCNSKVNSNITTMDRVEAKSYLHAAKSHSSSSLNSSRPALPEVASNESYRRLAERQDRLDELLAWMADKLTSLDDKITKIYHGKAHASVTDDDVLQVFEKRINQPQLFKKLVDKAAETTWPGLAISHFANYYAFK